MRWPSVTAPLETVLRGRENFLNDHHIYFIFYSHLKTCMDQFNASSDKLVEQLKKKADGKTEVTMLEQLNRVAMDIIGKVGKLVARI